MCNKIIELEGLVVPAKVRRVCKSPAVPQDLTARSASESRCFRSVSDSQRGTSSQGVNGAVIARVLKDIIAVTFSSSFRIIQGKEERLNCICYWLGSCIGNPKPY